ncbi:MAG: DUF1800 family protein [Solirubrobacteraceae bacterium]
MAALPRSPIAVFRGRFTERHATRLLWRAGFGPKPGDPHRLARLGLDGAVASLTRPAGPERLIGRPPHDDHGQPLDPINVWGHDHCWWLDRMVRSNHQLVERMTLIWHSWFATSIEASNAQLMIRQNEMMRARALGNFHDLLLEVTRDPAMLLWLSGNQNTKYSPNENYAREVMELFTLGADRGYTQHDVREQARALTGFTNDWSDSGPSHFRFDPGLHDAGVKKIFGHRGRFNWQDTCRLCVEHPLHASFVVGKLWSYLVGAPVPAGVRVALQRTYVSSGHEVRPLVEAILRHPLFYDGPRMVIPPAVFCAGLLRAQNRTIETDAWAWIGDQAGQKLFLPPNVAGWDYKHWLDTSRWAGRFTAVNYAMHGRVLDTNARSYPVRETASQALTSALGYWHNPELSPATRRNLLAFSRRAQRGITADWEQVTFRILRQNALRALIPTTPEWQTC